MESGLWEINEMLQGLLNVTTKKAKFTMTMGYYEEAPVLKMKIREEFLKRLMDYVSSQ